MKWISSALQPGWQPTDLVAIPTAAGRQCHGQPKETLTDSVPAGKSCHIHNEEGPAGPSGNCKVASVKKCRSPSPPPGGQSPLAQRAEKGMAEGLQKTPCRS